MSKLEKAALTCPRCGHQQLEARGAFSSVCRKCGEYLRVQELLKPAPKAAAPAPERKRIRCFDCGAEFEVPTTAQSSMCKKCSSYIDLHDYSITSAVSKNFKTKGSFVIQPTGYVFNCEAVTGEAIIKGRFIGKLVVEGALTIFSTAQIKGSFTASRLIVPAANQFRWNGEIRVGSAEIEGELLADVLAQDGIQVKATGRLVGSIKAKHLTADHGSVLEVNARIGG